MKAGNVCRNLLAESIAASAVSTESPVVVPQDVHQDIPLSNFPEALDADVAFMLDALKLEELKPIFADEKLDIEGIAKLSLDNLRDIGILSEKDRLSVLEEAENIILTRECYDQQNVIHNHITCFEGHQLFLVPYPDSWICDYCENSNFENPDLRVWRCYNDKRITDIGTCDFDLCDDCKSQL